MFLEYRTFMKLAEIMPLFEAPRSLQMVMTDYEKLIETFLFFTNTNLMMIQQKAKDSNAQKELAMMQQQFSKPVINGKTLAMIYSDVSFAKNPKIVPHVLKYIYDMLKYIEPRLKAYVNPEGLTNYMPQLEKLKQEYREYVSKVS